MVMLFITLAIGLAAVPRRARRIQRRVGANLEGLRSAWGGTVSCEAKAAPWSTPRYAFQHEGVPCVLEIRISPRVRWARSTFPAFELGLSAARDRSHPLHVRRRGFWRWADWLARPSMTQEVASGDGEFDRRFIASSELGAAAPEWLRDPEIRRLVAALLDVRSAELELRGEQITLTRTIDSPERFTERRAIAPVVQRFSELVGRLTGA
jgi:hypothetical protein